MGYTNILAQILVAIGEANPQAKVYDEPQNPTTEDEYAAIAKSAEGKFNMWDVALVAAESDDQVGFPGAWNRTYEFELMFRYAYEDGGGTMDKYQRSLDAVMDRFRADHDLGGTALQLFAPEIIDSGIRDWGVIQTVHTAQVRLLVVDRVYQESASSGSYEPD